MALKSKFDVMEEHIREEIEKYREHPNYCDIPDRIIAGLVRYRDFHIKPGDFLCHAIKNDFTGTVGRADVEMQYLLKPLAMFIWNEMPSPIWGSAEEMKAHLEEGKKDDIPMY